MTRLPMLLLGGLAIGALVSGVCPAVVKDQTTPMTSAFVVEDMAGRKVGFDRPPESVTIYPPFQIAFATIDGSTDRLAAIPEYIRGQLHRTAAERIFPRLTSLPSSGRFAFPDAEQFLRSPPEAAIVWRSTDGALEKIRKRGVVEIDFTEEDYKNVRLRMWRLLGAIAGKIERAEELFSPLPSVDVGRPEGRSIDDEQPTSVLWAWMFGDDRWAFVSARNHLNEFIRSGGGANLADRAVFKLDGGFEEIIRYDPEVILLDPPVDAHSPVPQTLYAAPAWRPLRAVRNRRVYVMPRHLMNNPAVDEPLLVTWLTEILHPSATPRTTRAAYRDRYRRAYGYEMTDREIDEILFVAENSLSSGYERFFAEGSLSTRCRSRVARCPPPPQPATNED